MIVELEKMGLIQQQLSLQEQSTNSVKEEAKALREIVNVQKEQVDLKDKAITDLQRIATTQDENCKKLVEAAKPSFWSRFGTHAAALGVGGIIAAVLVLLL